MTSQTSPKNDSSKFQPNLSKHIVPEIDCKNCGKCCERFTMFYSFKNDPVTNSEAIRLMMLEGIGEKMHLEGDVAKKGTWLIIEIPCKYLTSEKQCAIYTSPDRPLLCRKYPHHLISDCPKVRS
jgi:Fe-S-cluster containining protein